MVAMFQAFQRIGSARRVIFDAVAGRTVSSW